MKKMISAIIERLLESYNFNVLQISKDWFILFRILFMIASIVVYVFSTLTILAVVLLVIFIVVPISFIYKMLFYKREKTV